MKTRNPRRRRSRKSPVTAARRVAVKLPVPLFDRAERATRELSISRSELIRQAVERFVEHLRQERLERELVEGYSANARLDRAIGQEFRAVDYDTF